MISLHEFIDKAEFRAHGNGFLQADINERCRMHFWGHADIPRQATLTPIHDHIFSFRSTVLKGQMINIMLTDVDGLDNEVYEAVATSQNDTDLVPTGRYCNLLVNRVEVANEGDTYVVAAGQIHATMVYAPTVTVIEKLDRNFVGVSQGARVFVPWGVKPDNAHRRDAFDQDRLREIAKEIAGKDFHIKT